jgi:hypothetical protein
MNEAIDIPAHHDYRAVLAQVKRTSLAVQDTALASVLPNTNWDTWQDSLLRTN